MNIDWALRVLNLDRGSTAEDLKRAYRREAQRWHPDRYLAASAEEQADANAQMKRVNEAYEFLSGSTAWKTKKQTQTQTPPREPASSAKTAESKTKQSSAKHHTYSQTSSTKAKPDPPRTDGTKASGKKKEESLFEAMKNRKPKNQKSTGESSSGWTRFAVWAVVVGVMGAARSYNNRDAAPPDFKPTSEIGSASAMLPEFSEQRPQELGEATDNRELEQVEEIPKVEFFDPRPFLSQDAEPKERPIVTLNDVEPLLSQGDPKDETKNVDTGVTSPTDSVAAASQQDFFTIGSTFDEVIALQGTPDDFDGNRTSGTLWYGSSHIQLSQGRVAKFNNSTGRLKAKVLPAKGTVAREYFTIGSSFDEVLALHGTPDDFDGNRTSGTLWYGSSHIQFSQGRVAKFSNSTGRLKAKVLPASGTVASEYFTIGSSFDEVIVLHGTPDDFDGNRSSGTLWYGSAHVQFKNGRVAKFSNSSGRLKVRVLPRSGTVARDYFTIGSTFDEVISIQGTPDDFDGNRSSGTLWYGSAHVQFKNGRVAKFSNSSGRLKVRIN